MARTNLNYTSRICQTRALGCSGTLRAARTQTCRKQQNPVLSKVPGRDRGHTPLPFPGIGISEHLRANDIAPMPRLLFLAFSRPEILRQLLPYIRPPNKMIPIAYRAVAGSASYGAVFLEPFCNHCNLR